jgi:hypothetical protein
MVLLRGDARVDVIAPAKSSLPPSVISARAQVGQIPGGNNAKPSIITESPHCHLRTALVLTISQYTKTRIRCHDSFQRRRPLGTFPPPALVMQQLGFAFCADGVIRPRGSVSLSCRSILAVFDKP